ncbi:MAG TPA: O-antigen ligase family protein [Thermoanaerobaculia bacterium]
MAKRKRRARSVSSASRRAAAPSPPPVSRLTLGEAVAVAALIVVLAGTALAVDPGAQASFDAPKRLVTVSGVVLAAIGAFGLGRRSRRFREVWHAVPFAVRLALGAAAAALLWSVISAVLSPRRAASLDSLRALLLYSTLIPLGASRAAARGKTPLVAAFLAATAANAVISLLQSRGVQPFRLETFGTRNETGALAGNVGYLTLAVALAAVLSLGLVLTTRGRPRTFALAGLVLFVAALLVNRNRTALLSLGAGGVALVVALFGRRSLAPIAGVAAVLVAAVIFVGPLRDRAGETFADVRAGDWDRLTTYRAGAWAAAIEMARERPLAGWGPGTYAAEFVPHRLRAEIRARRRFVNPLVTSSYSEAHCDYLQAFAETGVPGGVTALVAAGALLTAIGGKARAPRASRPEAAILLGILVAGAVAALTWFPLQRPISAAPLLLAAGRSWRLAAGWGEEATSP